MWWSYQDVAEAKERIQREIARRVKRGERFEPLAVPAGKKSLCGTFWGQAWCRHLETYQQYESRLPRGRSYLRQGNVYNLEITPGNLAAVVAGSELYDTRVRIEPLKAPDWQHIVRKCEGQVSSMLDLLAGRLGDGVMRMLSDPEHGLFPQAREIRFDCSCPDFADMCKHVSAVLYGAGVLLDAKPELLFTLRGVDGSDLLAQAKEAAITGMAQTGDELAGADLGAIFGIDLAELPVEPETAPAKPREKPSKPPSKRRKRAS